MIEARHVAPGGHLTGCRAGRSEKEPDRRVSAAGLVQGCTEEAQPEEETHAAPPFQDGCTRRIAQRETGETHATD